MRIAFVYDWVYKFGGAERILLALHEIWPDAPLYTSVYSPKKAAWAKVFKVKTSFLRYFFLMQNRHELLTLFLSYAFESFDFSQYDVVLSVTSTDAKCIITKPQTLHICYCLTPTRYLWSGYADYYRQPGMGILNSITKSAMDFFCAKLRHWDIVAANRPDKYLAISDNVATRIKKYYHQSAEVIYPPVDIEQFSLGRPNIKKNYFLIVSRLVPYKAIDYAISAFNKLGWKLVIIGKGVDEKRLKSIAKDNIEFISADLTDKDLGWYYQNCQALIFPGEEDFGLTAVEAQACGKPVIAYSSGGVKESIVEGITGELYDTKEEKALISALQVFKRKTYSSLKCRNNALKFAKNIFKNKIKTKIEKIWQNHKEEL